MWPSNEGIWCKFVEPWFLHLIAPQHQLKVGVTNLLYRPHYCASTDAYIIGVTWREGVWIPLRIHGGEYESKLPFDLRELEVILARGWFLEGGINILMGHGYHFWQLLLNGWNKIKNKEKRKKKKKCCFMDQVWITNKIWYHKSGTTSSKAKALTGGKLLLKTPKHLSQCWFRISSSVI